VGGVVSGALAVWVEETVDPAGVAQQQLVVRPARVLLVLTCTHRQQLAESTYHTKEKQVPNIGIRKVNNCRRLILSQSVPATYRTKE
jgi:hypothetical protein